MSTVVGKVEAVELKPTKNGGTFTKFSVAGTRYTAFVCPALTIGDEIEFEGQQNANPKFGWDARNIKKLNGNGGYPQAVPAVVQSPAYVTPHPSEWKKKVDTAPHEDREPRIVRQNAMSTAAIIVAARIRAGLGQPTIPETFAEMLDLAEKVYEANFNGFPTEKLAASVDPF